MVVSSALLASVPSLPDLCGYPRTMGAARVVSMHGAVAAYARAHAHALRGRGRDHNHDLDLDAVQPRYSYAQESAAHTPARYRPRTPSVLFLPVHGTTLACLAMMWKDERRVTRVGQM